MFATLYRISPSYVLQPFKTPVLTLYSIYTVLHPSCSPWQTDSSLVLGSLGDIAQRRSPQSCGTCRSRDCSPNCPKQPLVSPWSLQPPESSCRLSQSSSLHISPPRSSMRFSLCRSSRATFQPAYQNDKAAAASHCILQTFSMSLGLHFSHSFLANIFLHSSHCMTAVPGEVFIDQKNIIKNLFLFTFPPTSTRSMGTSTRVTLSLHFPHFRLSDTVFIDVEILRPVVIIE